MLPLLWLALFLLAACLLLLMPLFLGREFYERYRGSRAVVCPENRQQVAVGIDALRAAIGQLAGRPRLRIAQCSRWPEHADCGQECMPEACRVAPYTKGEMGLPRTKKIYHLPVLIAAFAAWALGAFWHSQYLFRAQWMEAVGLSRFEVHQLVWRLAPHILTFAIPLLFAYGVAWLLSSSKRKGFWRGGILAGLLWAIISGLSLAASGLVGLSSDLLRIEITYTFLASILVGIVVGGLSGKIGEQAVAK